MLPRDLGDLDIGVRARVSRIWNQAIDWPMLDFVRWPECLVYGHGHVGEHDMRHRRTASSMTAYCLLPDQPRNSRAHGTPVIGVSLGEPAQANQQTKLGLAIWDLGDPLMALHPDAISP